MERSQDAQRAHATRGLRSGALAFPWFVLLLACAVVGACKGRDGGESGPAVLNGAGATFPYPLYSKWMAEYGKLDPRVRINYQSIGSGGGIRQIMARTVEFGASDAPMSDELLAKASGKLLHIPTTIGAVVLTYNLEGKPRLRLSPEVIARIFLGEIKAWDDPALVALNEGVTLPARPITVVHRSDGSGTTSIFTDYLSRVHPAWRERVGSGKSVRWPTGLGAKGNEGVTGQVKTTPGSLGYIELAYAVQNKLPYAALRNRQGAFVAPSIPAITAAAASVGESLPEDLRVSIVDAPGADAYPIAAFTYILVYAELPPGPRSEGLVRFLSWAVHEGQRLASPLHYAPLPAAVVRKVEGKLGAIRVGGKPVPLGS